MDRKNYFKQAWALLTRDKGWIKPILVMTIANCVPIAGFLGVNGYVLEWARLTAWGVDSSPKQKNVQVGKCISSGWRAFLVTAGMGLCVALVFGILQALFGILPEEVGTIFTMLLGTVQSVFTLVFGVFSSACAIRAAIYESVGAGYRVDRVFEMVKRDTSGFARIVLFSLAAGMIFFIIGIAMVFVAIMACVPLMIAAGSGASEEAMLAIVAQSLVGIVLCLIVFIFVVSLLTSLYTMLFYTIIALWMRQFDIPSWGKSSDPLPATATQDTSHDNVPVKPQRVVTNQSVRASAPQKKAEPVEVSQVEEPIVENAVTPAFNSNQDLESNTPTSGDWAEDDQTLVYDSDAEPEPAPELVQEPEQEILTSGLEPTKQPEPEEQPAQPTSELDPEIDDLYKRLDGIIKSDDE